jgi:hypothetical protein
MPAIHEQYSEELRSEFDYLSTWLPNAHIELGDIGNLHRDRFDRLTSAAELGLQFAIRDRERDIDLDYSSANGVGVEVHAGADAIAQASVQISVSFSRQHGMIFQAKSCRITEIADRQGLGRQIIELAKAGQWPAKQVVVSEVISTGPAVVIISQQRDAHIDLATDLIGLVNPLPLASASAALNVISAKGIGVKVIAPHGLTPLFRVSGVRRRLLSGETFGSRGGLATPGAVAASEALVFAELTYEDVGA